MPTAEALGALGSSAAALEVGAAGRVQGGGGRQPRVQLSSKYACFLGETTVVGEILNGGGALGQQNAGDSEII